MPPKMHADEIAIDTALVRQLLAGQFPHWAELPLRPITSAGTDHAIFRLGETMSVRLARIGWAEGQAEKERRWLPVLGPLLPLTVPEILAIGRPAGRYPFTWSVTRWLPGENLTPDRIPDPGGTAHRIAVFLKALQAIDTTYAPPAAEVNSRGLPLIHRDADVRRAIRGLDGLYDPDKLTATWEQALKAADWDQPPVWIHGDMLPGNLLFTGGQLTGVIDFGGLAVGDPACDLMIAWGLFGRENREMFQRAVGVDNDTWARGRGHALAQALIYIPYYMDSNPVGVGYARRAVDEILIEQRAAS